MAQHLERLAGSTEGAGIKAAEIIAKLPEIIREGLARPEVKGFDGIVKPYITGGDVNDNGTFPHPRFFVVFDENIHKPTAEEMKNGIALEPNRVARPYPLIKSTNYLFGFIPLAKTSKTNFESLYITPEGEITEAMSSNFFLCKEGKIITAPVGRVLKGRDARHHPHARARKRLHRRGALPARGGAGAGRRSLHHRLRQGNPPRRARRSQKIGSGRPGPAVQRLQHIFLQNMPKWLDK